MKKKAKEIAEDMTTADISVPDTRIGTMKKNNTKPTYGYSYLNEDEFTSDQFNSMEKDHHDKNDLLRSNIVTTYDMIIDSGLSSEIAIGQVAAKFRVDPEYVKALTEQAEKTLTTEIMTEKEQKTKKLLESYGIVTKAKEVVEETDEAEESTDDSEEDEKDEKKKGPKKGVNPFAKKDKKDDESEEEESEEEKEEEPAADDTEGSEEESNDDDSEESEEETKEEESHSFKAKGNIVEVKGADRELAIGLAAKLFAPFPNSIDPPKGKYTITFEPAELDEYAEVQPSDVAGGLNDKGQAIQKEYAEIQPSDVAGGLDHMKKK